MRSIALVLCLLLAFGAALAGTEDVVPKDAKAKKTPEKADAAAEPADSEACEDHRASFNTLEDIFSGATDALEKEGTEDGEAAGDGKAAAKPAAKPAPAVQWKEVRKEDPQD